MIWLWIFYPVAEAFIQRWIIFIIPVKRPDGSVYYSTTERPNYLMLNTIRFGVAILFGALMKVHPEPWWQWPALLCFQVGVFGLLFDPLLNWRRNMRPILSYEGNNSGWLKDVPYWLQAILSVLMILVGLKYF